MKIKDLPEISAVIRDDGKPQFVVINFSKFTTFVKKLELSGEIDEKEYLKVHQDVAKAVAERKYTSAKDHYVKSGYGEKRIVKLL